VSCADVLDLVDAIASGEPVPGEDVRRHLETCARCAAALATARRIEALIAARPAPTAPARFTDNVRRRISRERWRAEQSVDWMFNIAIAAGILLIIGGLAAMMNLQTILVAAGTAWSVVATFGGGVARQAVPAVATYAAAFGLLMSTLGIWWWAERRLSL
jgi:anti-sigma factor RsiW